MLPKSPVLLLLLGIALGWFVLPAAWVAVKTRKG